MTNEEKIWSWFRTHTDWTEYGIAALMGNFRAESAYIPDNLQDAFEQKLAHTDESYTAAVDAGTYTAFASDGAGYGLAQWTYPTRKAKLLAFAKAQGTSVGDLETQCAFCLKELQEDYPLVERVLRTAESVPTASAYVLTRYEAPANQSIAVQNVRAGYGLTVYSKYNGTVPAGTAGESGKADLSALLAKIRELAALAEGLEAD